MATWDITTSGAKFNFDLDAARKVQANSCFAIDSNHFIDFYFNSFNGSVNAFIINTSTWAITTGAAPLIFDTQTNNNSRINNSCFKVDTNHFINFWGRSVSLGGFAQTFVVNTTTWAVTTASATQNNFDLTTAEWNSCYKVDTNHFINFWSNNTSMFVEVFAVNTTTWATTTAASSLQFATNVSGVNSCYQIDANHFINFWDNNGLDNNYAQVFTVNTTTWAVTTAGAVFTIDTLFVKYETCFQVDANHFINFWGSQGGVGKGAVVEIFAVNTSTWAVSTVVAKFSYDTNNPSFLSCFKVDTNHFINFYNIGVNSIVQNFEVNTSTWAITTVGVSLTFDTATMVFTESCYQVDNSHFIDFWGDNANQTGFTQIFGVQIPVVVANTLVNLLSLLGVG